MISRLRQSPWRVLAVALLVAAIGCGIAAAITWSEPAPIEGAYLNRSIGGPAYSGVYSTWNLSGDGVAGGRVWLGAAIGLAIAAVLVAAISVWQSRRRSGGPAAPRP